MCAQSANRTSAVESPSLTPAQTTTLNTVPRFAELCTSLNRSEVKVFLACWVVSGD
jgi:hypothetical protein